MAPVAEEKAGDKSDAPRRKKAFHSKVRTGCKTCRSRKVKCDERKPTCARCARTGWKCEGYDITLKISAEDQLTCTLNPNGNFLESQQDAQAFQYYLASSVSRLQSVSFSALWDRFIPQARHEYAAVNHALLAVAARQFARETHPDQATNMRQLATSHYCKALRQVADSTLSFDVLMLCCLLFVVYENLGYWRALTHARNGVKLIQEWHKGNLTDVEIRDRDLVTKELTPMFMGRIAQLISTIDDPGSPASTYGGQEQETKLAPTIPSFFSTISDAHTALSGIVILVLDKMLHFEEQYSPGLDVSIVHSILDKWQSTFQRYCIKNSNPNPFNQDYRRLLWVHHRILRVMLLSTQFRTEMGFDVHRADFEYILSNSILVNASQMKPPTGLGLVAPLYLVATRCRDPVLRRKAVAQLRAKAHQSEMMLMACPSATLANYIIWLEERDLPNEIDVAVAEDIPEERRVKTLRVSFSPTRRNIEVEFRWWKSEEIEGNGSGAHHVERHIVPMEACTNANCATTMQPEVVVPKVDPSIMRIINGYIAYD